MGMEELRLDGVRVRFSHQVITSKSPVGEVIDKTVKYALFCVRNASRGSSCNQRLKLSGQYEWKRELKTTFSRFLGPIVQDGRRDARYVIEGRTDT